jgi:hypothetical protein
VQCTLPLVAEVSVRNIGLASLPAGAVVGIFHLEGGAEIPVGQAATTQALFPGQTQKLSFNLDGAAPQSGQYIARIVIDPQNPTFHECREDNNASAPAKPACVN